MDVDVHLGPRTRVVGVPQLPNLSYAVNDTRHIVHSLPAANNEAGTRTHSVPFAINGNAYSARVQVIFHTQRDTEGLTSLILGIINVIIVGPGNTSNIYICANFCILKKISYVKEY